MKMVTFAIYKQENIWGLETTDHNKLVRSQHGSRVRALTALFRRYPNLTKFYIILPDNHNKKSFLFEKDQLPNLWSAESIYYTSRAKALSSFFARHPGITLFYVTIPVKVGIE